MTLVPGDLIESETLFKSVIYTDDPTNIEMLRRENYIYVPSKAGGPILYYADPNKLASMSGKGKPSFYVADGKGKLITEVELQNLESNDLIYKAGWTDDYRVMVVTKNKFAYKTQEGIYVVPLACLKN